MARKPVTAAELMGKLEVDPEWVVRREVREAESAALAEAYARDEAGMVSEIRAAGFDIDSVWDLVNNTPHPLLGRRISGPYPAAYPVLIRHLDLPHHPRVREGIIRALTVPDGGRHLEEALLTQFRSEQDHSLRWVLANALRIAMPNFQLRKHQEIAAILKMDT